MKTEHLSAQLTPLTEDNIHDGLRYLHERDAGLARILDTLGPPPLWAREPGFPTLVHIILEQQVSLASAWAAFDRLKTAVNPLTPAGLLALDDATLRAVGFSRQKMTYARHLAQTIVEGELNLDALHQQDDDAVRAALIRVKGIGRWTADVYLLMALRRPDAWPGGDLGLVAAVRRLKEMSTLPTPAEMEAVAEPWRPWRAVAARLLWRYYLSVTPTERKVWAKP